MRLKNYNIQLVSLFVSITYVCMSFNTGLDCCSKLQEYFSNSGEIQIFKTKLLATETVAYFATLVNSTTIKTKLNYTSLYYTVHKRAICFIYLCLGACTVCFLQARFGMQMFLVICKHFCDNNNTQCKSIYQN